MREVFRVISKRDDKLCNFVEGGPWGEGTRIVYRHYATLYFIFCVDESESELGILDLIQVFVESLDKCFSNVCELDLVFHMDRVRPVVLLCDVILQLGCQLPECLMLTLALSFFGIACGGLCSGACDHRRDCPGWDGIGNQYRRYTKSLGWTEKARAGNY